MVVQIDYCKRGRVVRSDVSFSDPTWATTEAQKAADSGEFDSVHVQWYDEIVLDFFPRVTHDAHQTG